MFQIKLSPRTTQPPFQKLLRIQVCSLLRHRFVSGTHINGVFVHDLAQTKIALLLFRRDRWDRQVIRAL